MESLKSCPDCQLHGYMSQSLKDHKEHSEKIMSEFKENYQKFKDAVWKEINGMKKIIIGLLVTILAGIAIQSYVNIQQRSAEAEDFKKQLNVIMEKLEE